MKVWMELGNLARRLLAAAVFLSLLVGAGSGAPSKRAVLKRATAVDPLCERANPENVSITPYFRGIQIVHIAYGLNRDPAPTPRRLFLLPNGRIVAELAEALKRRKVRATDRDSALAIAAHLVEQEEYYNGGGTVVANDEILGRVPEDWRAKVALPEVTEVSGGFRVIAYLYRPAMENRFRRRAAALVRYEVTLRGFTVDLGREELAGALPGLIPHGE